MTNLVIVHEVDDVEHSHPGTGLIQGQRSHTVSPTDCGYLISVLWDSKE